MGIDVKRLKEIIDSALDEGGGDLKVVTTGHYGEPYEYDETDFYVGSIDVNEGLMPIKPREVFKIDHKDIGPEPD